MKLDTEHEAGSQAKCMIEIIPYARVSSGLTQCLLPMLYWKSNQRVATGI